MVKSGTKEWSDESRNFQDGCEHDCLHCYARADAIRYKRVANRAAWCKPRLKPHLLERYGKVNGRIMFPTTHDITPDNLEVALEFLRRMLCAGNEVLLVSKPHEPCIKKICNDKEIFALRDQLTFRFTIGSGRDETLRFWDNKAPLFEERVACLIYAFQHGYKTSVSSEPYFDGTIDWLPEVLCPYITDTIWIGKLNKFEQRVDTSHWKVADWAMWDEVRRVQSDDYIWSLYKKLKDNPKVRWKESCKKVLGIPEEEIG